MASLIVANQLPYCDSKCWIWRE